MLETSLEKKEKIALKTSKRNLPTHHLKDSPDAQSPCFTFGCTPASLRDDWGSHLANCCTI